MAGIVLALCLAWRPLLLGGLVPLDGNMIAYSYPNWSLLRTLGADRLLPVWNPFRDMGEPFLADPQSMSLYPPARLFVLLPDFTGFLRVWVVFHTLLAAAFMGGLAWRMKKSAPAAAAAAALAAFNGFFTARVTFPNHFAAAAWLPAILYFQYELSPLGLGACVALQWLAGFPPFSLLSVVAVSAVACAQGRKGLKCLVQGGIVALGLAAAQWIPFIELLRGAGRAVILDPAMARQFSLAPGQLLKEALAPQWIRWSPFMAGDPAIVCFYVGLVAWALAGWAAWRGGRTERLLAAGALGAMLLSLGGHLPGFDAMGFLHLFRFPANWLLLATAAAALLAASGVARLRPSLQWAAAGLLLADLLLFLAVPRAAWSRPEFLSDPPALAGAGRGRIYHTDELRRAWEKGTLETEEDYLLMRDFLAPSFGAAFGVREASSYQTLRLRRANDYLSRMNSPGRADWAGVDRVVGLKRGALRVTRETIEVSRRTTARERIFFDGAGKVGETSLRPGFASARVVTAGGGALILSEMNYPGWEARVDGVKVETGMFAEAFPSVAVPPGEHTVEFEFGSIAALAGFAISVLTATAFLFAVL